MSASKYQTEAIPLEYESECGLKVTPNFWNWKDSFKKENVDEAIHIFYDYDPINIDSIAVSIDQARFVIKSLTEIVKHYDDVKDEIENKFQIGTRVKVNTKHFKDLEGEVYDVDKIDKERPLTIKFYPDKHKGFDSSFYVFIGYDEVEII